jgi:sugar lactone lactonase YvrE
MIGLFDPTPCALGEGALWHPERRALFWFDILNARLHGEGRTWTFPELVSAAGWIDRDRLMIASESRLLTFDLRDGTSETVCPLDADNPGTRSNDGRADPQGGFWIGTMGKSAEPGAGAIWRWYRGELRRLFPAITIPNAICFSPDGSAAYFTDTPTRQILRVALDAQGWPAGQPEVAVDLRAVRENPDGAVTDARGRLWVAFWGSARVGCFAPDGHELASIPVPSPHTSCPAFGGPGLRDLFVTTARQGLAEPAATDGATWHAPDVAQGRPEPRVLLQG